MCGFSHRSLCVKRCFLPVFLPILFIILFIFVPRLPPITDIEFDKVRKRARLRANRRFEPIALSQRE